MSNRDRRHDRRHDRGRAPQQAARPPQPQSLAELLDTTDPAEQLAKVQAILDAAQTPPQMLIVRVDQVTGFVDLAALGELSYDQMHRILDAAKETLRRRELAELAAERPKGHADAR